MFTQLDTVNGNLGSFASLNWSCWVFRYEEIFRLVPDGTFSASGADRPAPDLAVAALLVAQPLRPATPAAAPSTEVRKSRRSTPGARE